MLRNIWMLWTIGFHFIKNFFKREKYRVDNKNLSIQEKKANREKIYRIMQDLSRRMLKAAGTTLEIKGKENLPAEGPVVYMATHKGLFDTPVVAMVIDDPVIFIGKQETKKMPVFGKWFDATGSIYLARDDMRQSLQAILQGIKELQEGQSIVIFPEGKRMKSEGMGQFKAGSFKLATKANVPIVPIAIQNTQKILEEQNKLVKTKVVVNIGKMIDVPHLSEEEKKSLPKDVQKYVETLLEEITE